MDGEQRPKADVINFSEQRDRIEVERKKVEGVLADIRKDFVFDLSKAIARFTEMLPELQGLVVNFDKADMDQYRRVSELEDEWSDELSDLELYRGDALIRIEELAVNAQSLNTKIDSIKQILASLNFEKLVLGNKEASFAKIKIFYEQLVALI